VLGKKCDVIILKLAFVASTYMTNFIRYMTINFGNKLKISAVITMTPTVVRSVANL